LKRQHGKK
jgi:hypothetical protein